METAPISTDKEDLLSAAKKQLSKLISADIIVISKTTKQGISKCSWEEPKFDYFVSHFY